VALLWQNGRVAPLGATDLRPHGGRHRSIRRPTWARVVARAALVARTRPTTASVPTP